MLKDRVNFQHVLTISQKLDRPKLRPVMSSVRAWRSSWKRLNFVFWTKNSIARLIQRKYLIRNRRKSITRALQIKWNVGPLIQLIWLLNTCVNASRWSRWLPIWAVAMPSWRRVWGIKSTRLIWLPIMSGNFNLLKIIFIINKSVTACDIRKTPLDDNTVNVAVFSLSLMATNVNEFILEANRILVTGGKLIIAEGFVNYCYYFEINLFYQLNRALKTKRNSCVFWAITVSSWSARTSRTRILSCSLWRNFAIVRRRRVRRRNDPIFYSVPVNTKSVDLLWLIPFFLHFRLKNGRSCEFGDTRPAATRQTRENEPGRAGGACFAWGSFFELFSKLIN